MAMVGGVSMFVAIIMGAFGAHGLKGRMAPEMLDIYKTGVYYQIVHSLAILALAGLAGSMARRKALERVCWLFAAGIVLFSGSLYLLALTGMRWLGWIAPFGGLAFLGGWALVVKIASSVRN